MLYRIHIVIVSKGGYKGGHRGNCPPSRQQRKGITIYISNNDTFVWAITNKSPPPQILQESQHPPLIVPYFIILMVVNCAISHEKYNNLQYY